MQPFVIDRRSEFKNVRLIDSLGEYHESIFIGKAREMASNSGLDLVCFNLPEKDKLAMCKLINYGKWKYHNDKTIKKNANHKLSLKEMRFSPVISDHDIEYKVKQVADFLKGGHEVLLTMRFKGIQKRNFSIGEDKMVEIIDLCKVHGEVVSKKKTNNQIFVRLKKT